MSHHSPPLHPYTPLGGQTLHCARALHGILRSGGQPSQFSTLVHPNTPSGGQTHIHTCLPVREAHLKVGENKTIEYITPKDNTSQKCPIPSYFYKVVLKVNKSGSAITSARAVGFWFVHQDYTGTDFSQYSVSVDEIERWTGMDFFVNLPDTVEATAEQNSNWSTFQNF